MGFIKLNGQSSEDLVDSQGVNIGLEVEHYPAFEMPERNYTVTHIPGRNGDGVFDPGDYKNVDREYEIAFGAVHPGFNYSRAAAAISKWLHNPIGVVKTFEPLANYKGELKAFLENSDHDYYVGDIRKEAGSDTYYRCIKNTHGYDDSTAWLSYTGSLPTITLRENEIVRIRNRNSAAQNKYVYMVYTGFIEETATLDLYDYMDPFWLEVHPVITEYHINDYASYMGVVYKAIYETDSVMWRSEDWEEYVGNGASGYMHLEDSYEPDVYRLAMYKESNTLSNIFNRGGQAKIKFNCQPQRFLNSGNEFGTPIHFNVDNSQYGTNKVKILENLAESGYGPFAPILKITLKATAGDDFLDAYWGAGTKIHIGKKNADNTYVTIWQIFLMDDSVNYYNEDHTSISFYLDCENGKVYNVSSFNDGSKDIRYPAASILLSRDENIAKTVGPLVGPGDAFYAWCDIAYGEEEDTRYEPGETFMTVEVKPRWWIV